MSGVGSHSFCLKSCWVELPLGYQGYWCHLSFEWSPWGATSTNTGAIILLEVFARSEKCWCWVPLLPSWLACSWKDSSKYTSNGEEKMKHIRTTYFQEDLPDSWEIFTYCTNARTFPSSEAYDKWYSMNPHPSEPGTPALAIDQEQQSNLAHHSNILDFLTLVQHSKVRFKTRGCELQGNSVASY